MSALRILVVSHRYPPYVAGGYELRTRDVVEGLRRRGHRVSVLTGQGAQHALDQPSVDQHAAEPGPAQPHGALLADLKPALDGPADLFGASDNASNVERFRLHFFRFANWRTTLRALDRTGAELLLFHNLSMLSLAPILAAHHAGIPTLGDVSDPWPENHWVRAWRANHERDRAAGLRGKGLRLAALESAWRMFRSLVGLGPLLVPSRFLADCFERDGIGADSIQVLPTALGPGAFDAPIPARAERGVLGSPQAPLRVLTTSALWEGKGVHVLVEALRSCSAAGVHVEARLAGDGAPEYIESLRAAAQARGDAVQVLGRLSREQVLAELDQCDAFCLPSLWGEPYSRAPMEAMLRGVPVIVSDAGGSPELVRHGRDGWVVPAGDAEALGAALVRFALEPALRTQLSNGGTERVRTACDFEHYLSQVEAACLRAAGRSPGPGVTPDAEHLDAMEGAA